MIQKLPWALLLVSTLFWSMAWAGDSAPDGEKSAKPIQQPEMPKLTAKQQQEVENLVRELQRQRATNRTRAEKHLSQYGVAAVPYLLPVSRSGFDLSRIAALRLLLKSPRYEAAPAALEGLTARNRWVRKLSWQLIEKISGIRSSFPWEDDELTRSRAKKSKIWRSWYQEQERLRKLEEQRRRELEEKSKEPEKPASSPAKTGR